MTTCRMAARLGRPLWGRSGSGLALGKPLIGVYQRCTNHDGQQSDRGDVQPEIDRTVHRDGREAEYSSQNQRTQTAVPQPGIGVQARSGNEDQCEQGHPGEKHSSFDQHFQVVVVQMFVDEVPGIGRPTRDGFHKDKGSQARAEQRKVEDSLALG